MRFVTHLLVLASFLTGLALFLAGCRSETFFSHIIPFTTSDDPASFPGASRKPSPFQFAAVHYTYADVFEHPDMSSERLTQCVYGDVVRIDEAGPWWYRVKIGPYPELEGWMHKAALTVLSAKALYLQERNMTTIVIRQNTSQVFIWPSATIEIVMGTELPFIGESEQWYLVRLPSNDIGRIAREAVYPSPSAEPLIQSKQPVLAAAPTKPGTSAKPAAPAKPRVSASVPALPVVTVNIPVHRRNIVAKAHEFIGIRYVWGGTTPRGLDCSGLSYLVYKLNGIELPRISWLQFRESVGQSIEKSQLQYGDLVFFTTYRKGPSHVGIYIGDNRFIHASPTSGVTISDLNDPYFRSRYIGARTVLSAS